jgi:hypothetical protein
MPKLRVFSGAELSEVLIKNGFGVTTGGLM